MGLLGFNSALPFVNDFNGVSTLYPASITLDAFEARVIADGGTFEAGDCLFDNLVYLYRTQIGNSSAFDFSTLILTANAYKANVMYAVKPNTSAGDFPFTRALAAYRTDSAGLLELMATGVPRLDYTGTYGDCPVWLFEPSRANLVTYSDDISNVVWNKVSTGTGVIPNVTAGILDSPFFGRTSSRIQFNTGGGTGAGDNSYLNFSVSGLTNPHTSTISIFVKSYDGNPYTIGIYQSSGAIFNIQTTDEWQRYELPRTTSATTDYLRVGVIGNSGHSAAADVLIIGAQFEIGNTATSSVFTAGAPVTRPADVSTRSDLQSESYLGATSGAFYIDYVNDQFEGNAAAFGTGIKLTAGTDRLFIANRATTATQRNVYKRVSGVDTLLYTMPYSPTNCRVCFVWNATEIDVYFNGIKIVTASAKVSAAFDVFEILSDYSRSQVRTLAFADSELTDTEALSLTGFTSLDEYLGFINYTSDNPALYESYT